MSISHGGGMMRAQSLSIMVSNRIRCNAGCQYCISRTTPNTGNICSSKNGLDICDFNRLKVGLNYAKYLGATHTILSGKADPTQENLYYLTQMIYLAKFYLPLVDMHTNGFLLLQNPNSLKSLVEAGLTMITLSIASFDPKINRDLMKLKRSGADLVPVARDLGLLVRCSLVVNKQGAADFNDVMEYIRLAGELGAQMVVVREVWVPEVYGDYNKEVYDWNLRNFVNISPIQKQFIEAAGNRENKFGLRQLDPLPWGTPVFVVEGVFTDREHGVNVTFARCEENTEGTVIKSIVHKPNGHGYRNWEFNGDILY